MLPKKHPIMLYDTLRKKKIALNTLVEKKVSIYMCGVTVYDDCHIGHARAQIALDMIIRYLIFRGYEICFVRNITDIDDKIIKKALEKQQTIASLVESKIESMQQDFLHLNLIKPNHEPKVTSFIDEIIKLIHILLQKGFAYLLDGDIYFRIANYKNYGQLSKQSLISLHKSKRVIHQNQKNSAQDFVLWKRAKDNEPSWDSPWGRGRPGWHIECSALAHYFLGTVFDIHAGGMDLCFPHHENEIAQSDGGYGLIPANYWLHIGLVTIDGEKMSKSLNNHYAIKAILNSHGHNALRWLCLKSHYRKPLSFSMDQLDKAKNTLNFFYRYIILEGLEENQHKKNLNNVSDYTAEYSNRFNLAMSNDFNVPKVISILFDMAKIIKNSATTNYELRFLLKKFFLILGFDEKEFYGSCNKIPELPLDITMIEELIAKRNAARNKAQYEQADFIRTLLFKNGIILEDGREGTKWKIIRKNV